MNTLDTTYNVGDMLIIETGEYSDRSWYGPVRILRAFSKEEIAEEFIKENPIPEYEQDWRTGPDPYDFLPWLIKAGYAEDAGNCFSWHVGSYGRFEP